MWQGRVIQSETEAGKVFQGCALCRDDARHREIRATTPEYDLVCFCPLTPAQSPRRSKNGSRNRERPIIDRMDRLDLESVVWVYEGESGVRVLLRGATNAPVRAQLRCRDQGEAGDLQQAREVPARGRRDRWAFSLRGPLISYCLGIGSIWGGLGSD